MTLMTEIPISRSVKYFDYKDGRFVRSNVILNRRQLGAEAEIRVLHSGISSGCEGTNV